jgi:glyoxylase-like metal-dependent hydrolase (beta-lactamase superfamily II)
MNAIHAPAMSSPARTLFQVGSASIQRVVESEYARLNPYELLPDATPELIESTLHWLAPKFFDVRTRMLVISMQGFVVRSGGKTVLVDTCVGDCKNRVRTDFLQQSWGWLDKLAKAGVTPEQVDYVVCTHFHVDHVGWNTRLDNGRWVPTFPNARYLFAQAEWDFWRSTEGRPGLARTGDYIDDSVLPVVEAGLADFVAQDHVLDDTISFQPAPGHTPGMVTVKVESQGQRAIIAGDVLHTPLQCRFPAWSTRFCADAVQSRITRTAFLETNADTGTLVFPAHFASPTGGFIERDGDAFRFRYASETDFLPPG